MSQHRPFLDYETRVGNDFVVRCADCRWAQVCDEDLHDPATDALLAWHVHHPEPATDHLSADGLVGVLRIPAYVDWRARDGLLDVTDGRTHGRYNGFNHAALAIFTAVAAGRPLEDAVTSEARRLGGRRDHARADVVAVAASLYQRGLLEPTAGA